MRRPSPLPNRFERQEAADPRTPGPRLQQLWDHYLARDYRWPDPSEIHSPTPLELALAGNPNTPPEVLRELADQCPREVVHNPAFPLVLLVDPGFFHPLEISALHRLLRRADTPAVALGSLQHHPDPQVAEGALWHVNLHGEAVPDLHAALDQVHRSLPRTNVEALEELRDLGMVADPIAELLTDLKPLTRPEAPARTEAIPFGETPPSAPEELLRWLLDGPGGPSSSSVKHDPGPRSPLAAALLQHGLDRWNVEARKCVAADPLQTAAVLEILAAHRLPAIRTRIAANPSTPVAALETLSHASMAYELSPLASNPSTPVEVLVRLSRHEWVEVAGRTLLCARLPAAEVDRLAQHREPWVRASAAQHPACSPEMLLHLAGDIRREVRRAVANAAATPPGATERMHEPALREATRDREVLVRWIALTHPEVPTAALTESADSGSWHDRLAAALHPATPTRDLASLLDDGNALVRAAARATMGRQEVESQS